MSLLLSIVSFLFISTVFSLYTPDWYSLDSRPNPLWYDDAKFGIFMHWGLYSVPSYGSEWMWHNWKEGDKNVVDFMKKNYRPDFTYADFGPMFTAEFFNPDEFASIVKNSGAKYYVITSKHHEGFTMYPSNYSWNWNSVDVGPKRDIVGELRESFLKIGGVHFCLYFSQFEWYHPLFIKDRENFFTTTYYPPAVSYPQLFEIVNQYKPDLIWSDGAWDAPDRYWNSTQFLAWLFNDSPVKDTVLVNDRWGFLTEGFQGSYYTFHDHFDPGHLVKHKWENAMTIAGGGWGFNRAARAGNVITINALITQLARTISCGGNLLLNLGPTHYGGIIPIFEERLTQMGDWLKINDEAVYGTKPWVYQNDKNATNVWNSTGLDPRRVFNPQNKQNTIVYAFLLDWPSNGRILLTSTLPSPETKITMLGYDGGLTFLTITGNGIVVDLTAISLEKLPSHHAWVIKFEYLASDSRDPLEFIEN